MTAGRAWLVGAGPGDPGLLTVAAREALEMADVVLHDALLSPGTLALIPPRAERVDVGKRAGAHSATQAQINELIVSHALAGKRVVRLKGGDPFTFGRGGEEALACRAAGVPFTIVPGVSSGIAGPAFAGIPVTHRGAASMVTFITAQEAEAGPAVDWAAAARSHTLVIFMGAGKVAAIAERLVANGAAPDTPAACIESATYPSQRVIEGTLGTIGARAAEARLGTPALIVVGQAVRLREDLAWFAPGPLADKRVAVTRPRGADDELGRLLAERGATVIDAPVVAIEPCLDGLTTDERISSRWDWIAFTSANAVDVFFDALTAQGKDLRAIASTKIAAIGPATADVLQGRGAIADFVPPEASGSALGEHLPRVQGARILLPVSTLARTALEDTLRRRGAHVERVEVYATVPAPLDASRVVEVACASAVTFASPSAVRALAAALEGAPLAGKLVSIGPGTSDAVREAFGRIDAEARERTAAGIAAAVEEALSWDS
jgi:uroporphyrinogen III methyltransferase/synthase